MRNNNLNLGGVYGNTISSVSGSVAPVSYNKDYNISTNGGLPSLIGSGSVYLQTSTSDPDGMCYCPYNGFMYITQHNASNGTSKILVTNPRTFTTITEITVGTAIWGIGYCPTNNKLYATDHGSSTLYVIDPSTNTTSTTISQGNIYGRFPTYCPATQRIYFTRSSNGSISEDIISCINPSTNTIEYTVTDGAFTQVGYTGPCYCPINGKLYYDNGSSVIVFDPITKTFSNITSGITNAVYKPTFVPSTGMIYVIDLIAHTLIEISPKTNVVTRTLTFPFSQLLGGMDFNPSNGFMYLSNYNTNTDNNITIVDVNTMSVVKYIPTGMLYSSGTYLPLSFCYCPSTKRMIFGTTASGTSTRIHQLT